ncbi:MAG TPA: HAD family hydrolase [Gemmatimonadaceae bacterium]
MPRFLDQFPVLLLDMNGTFMFGHDRFGPDEDYYATYRALGGRRLRSDELLAILNPSLEELLRVYDTPERIDDFPSLAEVFATHGAAADDIAVLERVFAAHEIGSVPQAHAETLHRLAQTHKLGVVSNLCSHPKSWLSTCASAEVFGHFQTLVFSSEGRSIKPSPSIFRRGLANFPDKMPVLFIGDSLERDIIPAKALGMSTAWIAPDGCSHAAADVVVRSLTDLPARITGS